MMDLIDKSEIPSDYGGSKGSLASFVQEYAKGSKRQQVELLSVKKRGKASCNYVLASGEKMTVRIYTRSASVAIASLHDQASKKCLGQAEVQGIQTGAPSDNVASSTTTAAPPTCTMTPCGVNIGQEIIGPAKIVVEVEDKNTSPKNNPSLSRGHFLVVSTMY